MIVSTLICATLILLLIKLWPRNPPNYPPGPRPWPVVGSILTLRTGRPVQETFYKLAKHYGPLVGMNFGNVRCVVANGYKAVRAISANEDCAMRPDGILFRARAFDKRLGVLFSDGSLWKEQRRFSLRHLRDFGFGKRSMESLIQEEIWATLRAIESRTATVSSEELVQQGVEICDVYPASLISILWTIMAGVRYEYSDPEFQALMRNVDAFFRNGSPTGGIMLMPILRHVPLVNAPYLRQLQTVRVLQDCMKQTIAEHKKTLDPSSLRDFIDVFLMEMQSHDDDVKSTFTEEQLVVLCMDLFLAGTETTSSTLAFLTLYLASYPEVQRRARDEIHAVVGTARLPALDDMPQLPYVQSVIAEVMRHAAIVAVAPPHFTRKTVHIMGHTIPKNTLLLLNLYSVFREQEHWGDPENFRPERYLHPETGAFVKDETLLLFGSGPRFCLGEPLARSSIFLFSSALLQRLNITLPTARPPPDMENHLQGFTTAPQPFTVTVRSVL